MINVIIKNKSISINKRLINLQNLKINLNLHLKFNK